MIDVFLAVIAFLFFTAVTTAGVIVFKTFVKPDFHDVWSDDD
jgi:hypothetical protein